MIIQIPLNPKKIEMIFLLTAEYSLKTYTEEINMATTQAFNTFEQTTLSFNPFKNLLEQIEYGALANSCGFGTFREGESSFACIFASYIEQAEEIKRLRKELEELKPQQEDSDDEEEEHTEEDTIADFNKEADLLGATAQQREYGLAMIKTAFEDEDPLRKAMTMTRDAITRVVKENEELKSQRPKYTCPQDEDLTGGDANYEYYYTTNEDGEMTIWKVPRHLAEIKSSTPDNWDNAVAECFRDEKFGENWDKLTYLIVREMKLKDLVKRKWKPAAEKPKEEEE